MKNSLLFFIILVWLGQVADAQPIPYGHSIDTLEVKGNYLGPLVSIVPDNSGTFQNAHRVVHFYKPTSYDPQTSPILWYMHGTGGSGASSKQLWDIAERRNALVVAPDAFYTLWQGATDQIYDTISCTYYAPNYFSNWTTYPTWLTNTFKQYYKWILQREGRDSIPVYFTGFSAGGQVVNKYMFFRQFAPDSIPIVMAVSVSPMVYMFPSDSANGTFIYPPCGIGFGPSNMFSDCMKKDSLHPFGGAMDTLDLRFICNDHIVQYFNENYGVLVGNQDVATYIMCAGQGSNRLEAARNFYAFCDSMATDLGTTLRWPYAEVPGIGHHDSLMYHTCAPGDSISIAERMLFETPWHQVPDSALVIDFEADRLRAPIGNATIHFTNKTINGISYLWDFGDSTYTAIENPVYTYTSADTFSVKLTATSATGCSYTLRKKHYVIILDDTGIGENELYSTIKLFPNPAESILQFELPFSTSVSFFVSDLTGRILENGIAKDKSISISSLLPGYYILVLQTEGKQYRGAFVKD
ncbi:MAG TPA: PKD domain-containing protein [Bacteroidales bacterium]|nr:PKD domain-containing protein [Bacteroidales bacterium]